MGNEIKCDERQEKTTKKLNELATRLRDKLDADKQLFIDYDKWVDIYKPINIKIQQIQNKILELQSQNNNTQLPKYSIYKPINIKTQNNNTGSVFEQLSELLHEIFEEYTNFKLDLLYNNKETIIWKNKDNIINIIPRGVTLQEFEENEEIEEEANDEDEKNKDENEEKEDNSSGITSEYDDLDKCFTRLKKNYKKNGKETVHSLIILQKFPFPESLCFKNEIKLIFRTPKYTYVTLTADNQQELRDDLLLYGMSLSELAQKYSKRWGVEITSANMGNKVHRNIKCTISDWIPYTRAIDGSLSCPNCHIAVKKKYSPHLPIQLQYGINCHSSFKERQRIRATRFRSKRGLNVQNKLQNYKIIEVTTDTKTYKFHMIPHKKCLESIFHFIAIKRYWSTKFKPQTKLHTTHSYVIPDELSESIGTINNKHVLLVILFNEAKYHFAMEQQEKEVEDYIQAAKQNNKLVILYSISCWGWYDKNNTRYSSFFTPDINNNNSWRNSLITGINLQSFSKGIGTMNYVLDGLFNNNNEFNLDFLEDKFDDDVVVLKFGYSFNNNYLRDKDIYLDKYYGKALFKNWTSQLISSVQEKKL